MKRFRIVKKPYRGILASENCSHKYVVQREVSLFDLHLFWKSIDWHFNEDRAKEIQEVLLVGLNTRKFLVKRKMK